MIELAFFAIVVALVFSFLNLRVGIYATLFVGFLQEPLRKLVPNEPVYLTALVAVFALVTFIGGKMQHSMLRLDTVPEWNLRLRNIALIFVVLVIFQCMAAFAYTGSLILAGIGFMAYLSPFPALQMSYSFANGTERIISFLWLYLAVNTLMSAGVYLSLLDLNWAVLRTVGEELVVYSLDSGAIVLPAGFYRVPELAAWHAASGSCLALALALSSRRQTTFWFGGALALFFFGAILLTGRRKFLIEIAIFMPVLLFLLYRFRLGGGRYIGAVAAATVLGVILAVSGLASDNTVAGFSEANLRGQALGESASVEMLNRLATMTIDSFPYVIAQNGIFGSGAGSGSQGAQYFGGGGNLVGLGAEGGLGKILAEVGIPGFVIVLIFGFKLITYVWQTLRLVAKGDAHTARLTMGLTAFLIANSIVFVTAAQAFGDLFVLLIIGFVLGFIIAIRRLYHQSGTYADRPDKSSMAAELYRHPART